MAKNTTAKIQIENVGQPGKTYPADAAKYGAMKEAILKVLPDTSPGLTVAEVQERVVAHLPESLFPAGATSGWWMKAVQLDLEAKASSNGRRLRRCGCTRVERCQVKPEFAAAQREPIIK